LNYDTLVKRSAAVSILLLVMAPGVSNAASEPKALAAASTDAAVAVKVDGELTETALARAEPVTMFVQRDPLEGAPPTLRTEARVAYDESTIYVSVRAFDPEPERIIGFLTRRDVGSTSDWIRVLIDSYRDRRTAYEFAVNPVGVKRDIYWFNDNNSDDSWDAVWDVVISRDPEGWSAEFRIPMSQLRFRSDGDGSLGFAVVREVARLNEVATWPLLAKSASGYVSSFGELTGVAVNRASKRLEVVPYAVAEVVTEPREPGNPLQKTPDPGSHVGVDLKYAVTPALSLTATVNPDFGQVEADPAVVNLTAFETFFTEKRPFFIEGSGTYQFDCGDGCLLFYSRRIGRAPRGSFDLADGEFSAQPGQSTILGAGKLTGRVGSFSLGVLSAATEEEHAQVFRGGVRLSEAVEPRTFYSVARARRDFADQSALGFMLTTTNRRRVETLSFLPDTAVAGGLDYDWRLGERWRLGGYWIGSSISGTNEAIAAMQENNVHSYQRPDAEHVELDPLADNMRGHAGAVMFSKIAGERTRMALNVAYKSPGFELNDVGFLRRADEIPQNSWLQIRWDKPGKYVRSTRINFNQWSSHNFDGDRLFMGFNFNGHWTFQNQWNTGFGVNANTSGFDDRLTRGGPGGRTNGNLNSWQYFNTDSRKVVSLNWNSNFGNDRHGSRWFSIEPRIVFRPIPALSTEFGIGYNDSKNDYQWVGAVTDLDVARTLEGPPRTHYVFGRLEQKTSFVAVRMDYTITPTLSVQVYAQPFVSSGRYETYKELVNGRAEEYIDRFAPYDYQGNADFKVLSFRTTNVMRWEFKPGSTLFVVWQQGREGFDNRGDFRFGRDYGDVFSTPATNTVLVKLAYWINP
jgi:hypothetical protein